MPVKDPVKPPPETPPPADGDGGVAEALALAAAAEQEAQRAAEQAAAAAPATPAGRYRYEVTSKNFAPHEPGDVLVFDEPVTDAGWLHHLKPVE